VRIIRVQKPFTIIVADDDSDDQYFIDQALKELEFPYTLKAVFNGLQLLDHLKGGDRASDRPDFIILDLNMPLLDGYGVLDQIKNDPQLKDIPVFVLSTSRFDHDARKTQSMGAAHFYSKPYRFEELKEIVREICDKVMPVS